MEARKIELKTIISRSNALVEKLTGIVKEAEQELAQLNSFNNVPTRGTWFIKKGHNKYYQFESLSDNNMVKLARHGDVTRIKPVEFNEKFEMATASDVARHLEYLKSKQITPLPTPVINVTQVSVPTERLYNGMTKIGKVTNLLVNEGTEVTRVHLKGEKIRDLSDLFKTQHKGFDVAKCDFYMLTVGEQKYHGMGSSVVRHTTYESAQNEAVRLCKLTNEEVFILGVVASVKPVETVKIVKIFTPTISKR